jgi:hypothetical protein
MPNQVRHRGWMKLCTGLLLVIFEFVSDCLHPELTEVLLIAGLIIPVVIMAALLAIITRSGEQTCERVFRLLRWMVNRPEPLDPRFRVSACITGQPVAWRRPAHDKS